MTDPRPASPTPTGRPLLVTISAMLIALLGLVFTFYYGAGIALNRDMATGLFVALAGALSLGGALGYWLLKRWGLYLHVVSCLLQVVFPGTLFQLAPDFYHLFAFFAPLVSIAILARMAGFYKKQRALQKA